MKEGSPSKIHLISTLRVCVYCICIFLCIQSRWQDDWGQKYRQRSEGLPLLQVPYMFYNKALLDPLSQQHVFYILIIGKKPRYND